MNIRQETTCLSGAKDGNENTTGFALMGKRGKMVITALKRFLRSQRFYCQCLSFLQKKNVSRCCWIFYPVQMSAELVEWWRRRRTQITRSQVMGGCTKFDVVFGGFSFVWGRGLATLLLFLYVMKEAGRKCVLDMPWPPAAECNMITNKETVYRSIGPRVLGVLP